MAYITKLCLGVFKLVMLTEMQVVNKVLSQDFHEYVEAVLSTKPLYNLER